MCTLLWIRTGINPQLAGRGCNPLALRGRGGQARPPVQGHWQIRQARQLWPCGVPTPAHEERYQRG